MSKTVLITGGAGFIGSHAVEHVLVNTDWNVVVLDALTYAGNTKNFTESEHYDERRVEFIHRDLRMPLLSSAYRALDGIDYVWHFASDSHVDNSLEDPARFFIGNAQITTYLLEWARYSNIEQFVQVSTDEVYGPAEPGQEHTEWSDIIPSNPYSASKAAQEAVAIAYWRSYGVPVVITNTMNNFGERQHAEKYVPMTIDNIRQGNILSVHAGRSEDGEWVSGSRYWLHARNHADALLWLSEHPVAMYNQPGVDRPDRYNIAGEHRTNLEIAELIADALNINAFRYEFVDAHTKRPGHDLHYGLDSAKLQGLGWKPPVDMVNALDRTVQWYLRNE